LVRSLEIKRNIFRGIIISGNSNVGKKETKNILKYIDHAIYIQHILNVKSKTIYVTTEETGTILLSFTKMLGTFLEKPSKEM
jgi:hypothetical protein